MADGSVPPNFTDPAAPVPAGSGILGEVVATGQRMARRKSDPDWKQLADPAWLDRERIESFVVLPIAFKDEVLGVIAALLRHAMLAESLPYGAMLAGFIGAAVVNARAFEEIKRLKEQLEQHNAYLEEEVLEARAFGDRAQTRHPRGVGERNLVRGRKRSLRSRRRDQPHPPLT